MKYFDIVVVPQLGPWRTTVMGLLLNDIRRRTDILGCVISSNKGREDRFRDQYTRSNVTGVHSCQAQ